MAKKGIHLYSASGLYIPTFLLMEVGTSHSLKNLNELSDEVLATWFHEYLHFLQDISTTFGLMHITHVVEYMKFCALEIQNSEKNFEVPIHAKYSNLHTVYQNSLLVPEYVGTTTHTLFYEINSITSDLLAVKISGDLFVNVDSIILNITVNAQMKTVKFGSLAIIESMAFLIEKSCFPSNNLISEFPYLTAKKVVNHIYPEFGFDDLNIIALCDSSLRSFNPGNNFYLSLIKMKKETWLPNKPEEVYEYCSSVEKINYYEFTNLDEVHVFMKNEAIKSLTAYFTDKEFKDIKKWISIIIEDINLIRKNNPYFFLEIAKGGFGRNNQAFLKILSTIGTPLILNLNGEATFYHPQQNSFNFNTYLMGALAEIFKVFNTGESKCGLYHACKENCHDQNIPDCTNSKCLDSPWDKVKESDALCPYAQFWYVWKLSGKTPIKSQYLP